MKSYLKFLSRNKLYTAIEAVGLIVSLAFIVIISCYTCWQVNTWSSSGTGLRAMVGSLS